MAGWSAGPPESKRSHYFNAEGHSLCGRYSGILDGEDRGNETPDDACARCLMRLTQKSTGVGKQIGLQGSGPLRRR